MNVDIIKILEELGRLHMQVTIQAQLITQLKAEIEVLKQTASPTTAT